MTVGSAGGLADYVNRGVLVELAGRRSDNRPDGVNGVSLPADDFALVARHDLDFVGERPLAGEFGDLDLVRVVNDVIDKLDLRTLEAQYKGGGTSSYHPKMLLKVLVYASRRIAKAVREQLPFLWLSGGQQPDFRTINTFRSSRMKGVIDEVFASVLEYLVETGHVKLEHYFVDGTKIAADANQHKVVWAKRKETNENRLRPQIQELLQQIEQVTAAENTAYGEKDLEEVGETAAPSLTAEALQTKIAELNARLQTLTLPSPATPEAETAQAAR